MLLVYRQVFKQQVKGKRELGEGARNRSTERFGKGEARLKMSQSNAFILARVSDPIITIINSQEFNFNHVILSKYGGPVRRDGFVSVFSSLWKTEGDFIVSLLFCKLAQVATQLYSLCVCLHFVLLLFLPAFEEDWMG